MADIATVLKKTIDGLPANTPAVRRKVYEKARGTIRAKLEARDPKPSQAAIDRQMEQVEKVISAVESDYEFREQIDSVFSEASAGDVAATPAHAEPAPAEPVSPEPAPVEPVSAEPVSAEPEPLQAGPSGAEEHVAEEPEPAAEATGPAPMPEPEYRAAAEAETQADMPGEAEPAAALEARAETNAEGAAMENPAADAADIAAEPEPRPAPATPSWMTRWGGTAAAPATSEGQTASSEPFLPDFEDPEPSRPGSGPQQQPSAETPPAETPSAGPLPGDTPPPDSMDYSDPAQDAALAAASAPQADRATAREDDAFDAPVPDLTRPAARKSGFKGMAIAIVVLLLLGAGGYAAWLNKEPLMALLSAGDGSQIAASQTPVEAPAGTPAETPAAAQEGAPPSPQAGQPGEPAPAQNTRPKFTQRLQPDGTEVDPGPAGGGTSIGEGTSLAQLTERPAEPPEQPAAPQEQAATTQDGAPEQAAAPGQPAVAVGQRAIFYEERTAVEQGTADQGNVVWSQVEESPGGDNPAEPAIRADVVFPERDLNLRITIRRNADETLPASHIIELVFVTPDNFPGGVIDDVLRITFKDNEQSPGTPLLGIPAKIADNFFLVALTDGSQEIAANLALMQNRPWIDIPVIYRTGRRALITMEKGLSGETVFKDVIDTWSVAGETSGG